MPPFLVPFFQLIVILSFEVEPPYKVTFEAFETALRVTLFVPLSKYSLCPVPPEIVTLSVPALV